MPFRDWLLNQGASAQRRAQHNAQILAKQRGLMPWDEDETDTAGREPFAPASLMDVIVTPYGVMPRMGAPTEAPVDAAEVTQGWPSDFPESRRRTSDLVLGPERPAEPEPTIEMPQMEQPTGNRADVLRGYGLLGSLNVDEGEGAPQTSFSDRFGVSATFRPGTRISGVGDPIQAQEARQNVAAQRDYDWRAGLLSEAAQIPEGVLRQLRTDPAAYAEAVRNQSNALSQGMAQLGARPSLTTPGQAATGAVMSAARAAQQAQPISDDTALAALFGEAGRALSPAMRGKSMGMALAEALGVLQPDVQRAAELEANRKERVAGAGSMWGGMTPAQTEGLQGGAQGSEGTPRGAQPGIVGRIFTVPQIQALAAEHKMSLEEAIQQVLDAGGRVQR